MCLTPHFFTVSAHDLVRSDAQSPNPVLQTANPAGSASPRSPTFESSFEFPVESPLSEILPGRSLSNLRIFDTLPDTAFTPPGFPAPMTEIVDAAQPAPTSYVSPDGLDGPGVHAPVPVYVFQDVDGCFDVPAPVPSRIASPNTVLHASLPAALHASLPDHPPPPYARHASPRVDRPLSNPTRAPLSFPGFVTTLADVDESRWQGSNGLLLLSENKVGQPIDGKPKFLRARARVAIDQLRAVNTPDGPALCGSVHLVPSQHAGRAFYFHQSMEAARAMEALVRTTQPRWFSFIRPYRGTEFQMMLLVLEEYPIRPIILGNHSQSINPAIPAALLGREVDVVFVCYQFVAPGPDRLISVALLLQLQLID
ncbi:hypothetical protein BDN72DRAFT_904939 [Pluteus cervinus]|uniref:Uncharacterized protein n=1 Tax=Pluteus cervinus TaxID=181527 RepID=A0ACD3A6M0_9AGAR|nr:hypothetical protein BDN72DRAFT_904939 [Pluteus cervinus]